MLAWKKRKHAHTNCCEDIKKARTLLKESGAELNRRVQEQSALLSRLEKKSTLILVNQI